MANKNQKVAMYIAIGVALALILLSSTSILDNLNIKGFSIVDSSYDGVISIREVYQEPLVLLQISRLSIL